MFLQRRRSNTSKPEEESEILVTGREVDIAVAVRFLREDESLFTRRGIKATTRLRGAEISKAWAGAAHVEQWEATRRRRLGAHVG